MITRSTFYLFLVLALALSACKSDKKEASNEETTQEAVEEKTNTAGESTSDFNYVVEPENSIILWEGYKPGRTHNGTVKIKSGKLNVENGNLTGGEVVLDMTSISVKDLKEGDGKGKLEGHLKGTTEGKEDDFFNTTRYPEATFKVTKIARLDGDEKANALIYGDLTIKGITKPVSFKAHTEETQNKFTARTEKFKVDRTKWDIKFMSRSFFDDLKDNFIEDEFGLTIMLVAEPK